ncbi:MAG: hypothetical protein CMO55_14525 [Verrucomicrobiales bacterium]|nr:hypothetical protein [Verrucomicrobiales bacterium]
MNQRKTKSSKEKIEYILEFWCSKTKEKFFEWKSSTPFPRYERGDVFDLFHPNPLFQGGTKFRAVTVVNALSELPDVTNDVRRNAQRIFLEPDGGTPPPSY